MLRLVKHPAQKLSFLDFVSIVAKRAQDVKRHKLDHVRFVRRHDRGLHQVCGFAQEVGSTHQKWPRLA